jgi:hypothetical protein
MELSHPLQNPSLEDLEKHEKPELKVIKANRSQLRLNLTKSRWDRWRQQAADIIARARRREAEVELTPYWRSMATPLSIVTGAFMVVGLFTLGALKFNQVGPTVPFLYDSNEARWEEAEKLILLAVPIFLLLIEGGILWMVYRIFLMDKRLSLMISWALTVINILVIIAAVEIYSLIS